MLPTPSANFKLPSLYDDLELDCRLYFPHIKADANVHGIAIFAHPYAPLGGSYDDHVVHTVGRLIINSGLLLVTFNFRGADKSPGKTSWSGKAELADYTSIYVFVLSFLNSGVSSQMNAGNSPLLLLGGYSYGSMMTAHLPPFQTICKILVNASDGSAEREIQLRAGELAQAYLGWCESRQNRGRSSLRGLESASALNTSFGGYESAQASSRISRDTSRISIDKERVRHSIDRVRQRLGSRGNHSSDDEDRVIGVRRSIGQSITPHLTYLLISPLLGAVSSFATMFSSLSFERRDRNATASRDAPSVRIEDVLSESPSLVIFGSDDHFTSSRKVRDWCESIKRKPSSRMLYEEVEGTGHFWQNNDVNHQLSRIVTSWLMSLSL